MLTAARYGHRLVWDAARNRIVLAGGCRSGFYKDTDAWKWDGQSWTERMQSTAPVQADSPALAYDPLSTALLLLGFSPTLLFGQIPLPLGLSSLGLTGCTLYTDVAAALPMVSTAGEAALTLPIPAVPNLAGGAFFLQGLFSDLAANPAGLLTTNAGAGVIGGK